MEINRPSFIFICYRKWIVVFFFVFLLLFLRFALTLYCFETMQSMRSKQAGKLANKFKVLRSVCVDFIWMNRAIHCQHSPTHGPCTVSMCRLVRLFVFRIRTYVSFHPPDYRRCGLFVLQADWRWCRLACMCVRMLFTQVKLGGRTHSHSRRMLNVSTFLYTQLSKRHNSFVHGMSAVLISK